ncbi:MAG: FAD-dependent oxidoreductase [Candidatus Accumulibacter sp.]|jgi:formate dehydrogenase beta subunit|nr:FAD-dependent oxidoreductase [Accumulibacter sp.]
MIHCVYGVWDGTAIDARRDPARRQTSLLSGFDEVAPDTAAMAFIADRGFLILDESTSLAFAFSDYLARAADESCGRCTPCRVGTQRLRDLLKKVVDGVAAPGALDEARALAWQITQTALCGMGQSCARALYEALVHFPEEFGAMTPAQAVFQHSFIYVTAPCIEACPSKIDVPKYIDGVKNGKFDFALGVVLDNYPMAGSCGRVCVRFCEAACRRNAAEGPVGIRMLKRYAADEAFPRQRLKFAPSAERHDKRVAVIGAGPAGITCAYKLLRGGIQVDVFDAQWASGGMAALGIPSYRLPKDVLKAESEDVIRQLGGHFLYGKALGRDFSVDDLLGKGYDAVFLAYGASKASQLGVRNEELVPQGYASGIDFLFKVYRHVEGGEPFTLAGDVVVVGGGNVAMDCVRSARRMGAKSVHLVYRRTIEDMPADREEVLAAQREGVVFHCLSNPSELVVKGNRVAGVRLVAMRQTEVDARGRHGVEPIPDSETFMACDWVIAAIGQVVANDVLRPEEGIELDRWNWVMADPDTLETSRPGVFAGGDCVLGPQSSMTLVNALDHGERAAASIRDYLLNGHTHVTAERHMQKFLANNHLLDDKRLERMPLEKPRAHVPELPVDERVRNFAEVDGVIAKETAYEEASRCLRCYRMYSLVTVKSLQGGYTQGTRRDAPSARAMNTFGAPRVASTPMR